jgi:hypothetical protein
VEKAFVVEELGNHQKLTYQLNKQPSMMVAGRDFFEKKLNFYIEENLFSFSSAVSDISTLAEDKHCFKKYKDLIYNSRYYSTVRACTIFSMMKLSVVSVSQNKLKILFSTLG